MLRSLKKFAEYPALHIELIRLWFVGVLLESRINHLEYRFNKGDISAERFVSEGDQMICDLDNIFKLREEIKYLLKGYGKN